MPERTETKIIDGRFFMSIGEEFFTQHSFMAAISEREYLAIKAIATERRVNIDFVFAEAFKRTIIAIVDGEK